MSIVTKNFSNPGLLEALSQKGMEMPGQLRANPVKTGYDHKKLYSWEIIPRSTYTLIHVFPDSRLGNDVDYLWKLREAAKLSCMMNLSNMAHLIEWFGRDDVGGFGSMCTSFNKVSNSIVKAELFIEDLESDFYKRCGLHRGT